MYVSQLMTVSLLQLTIEHDPDALRPRHTAAPIIQPTSPRTTPASPTVMAAKERMFRRRDEGYISGSRSRQLRRSAHAENKTGSCGSPGSKERSSSMSRLLDGLVHNSH